MKADETTVVYVDGIAMNVPYKLDVLPDGHAYKIPMIDSINLIDVSPVCNPFTEYRSLYKNE